MPRAEKNMEEPKRLGRKLLVSNERIFELRQQELSYKAIAQQLRVEGIEITIQAIQKRCKKIYAEKNMTQPKAKKDVKIEMLDKKIFELRQQGLTYRRIAQQLKVEGTKISMSAVQKKCKRIYIEKNMEEPKAKRKVKIDSVDKRILKLRHQGLTYKEIKQQLEMEGIKVSLSTIQKRCKKIYAEKNMEEPKAKKGLLNERIFELREQGLTYKEIEQQLAVEGIKISLSTIQKRCKEIYFEKYMGEPKVKIKIKKVSDERIFELRQQELSYEEISQQLEEEGIKISKQAIQKRCKRIYAEKNMEELNVKIKKVSDERIFELRQQGLAYREIAQQLGEEGITISLSTIQQRCKRIYAEKNMEEPKAKRGRHKKVNHKKTRIDISKMDSERILHIFNNIEHRKKATKAQLQELAEFYGIDYSKLKERNEKIRY